MTPVHCIAGPSEFGDCYRACLATVLDLPASDVPHFAADSCDSEETVARSRAWLANRELAIFQNWVSGSWSLEKVLNAFSRENPGVAFILHGEAAHKGTGDINHAVVVLDGKIVHDPSGAGVCGPTVNIEGERLWWWMEILSPIARAA